MAETLKRIKEFIDSKPISTRGFEISVGLSNGSFSNQLKNNKSIGVDKLENILQTYPELNPTWLLTGIGSMLQPIDEVLDSTKLEKMSIPLIPSEAFAGIGGGIVSILENDIQDRYVVPDFTNVDFMIRVKGNSMYPKYSSGDIVACRMISDSKFLQWNKVHVISTKEQGILIKRLDLSNNEDCITAISDNKSYRSFDIPKDEILNVAIVTGVIRLE